MGGSIKKCKQESQPGLEFQRPYFIGGFLSVTAAGTLNSSLAVTSIHWGGVGGGSRV